MDKNCSLKQWYLKFITEFRKETVKLSSREKSFLQPSTDFRKPLQIEIFWLENPTLQISLITHLKDRKDLEIIVNGPFSSHEFYESATKILNEKHWQRIVSARAKKASAGSFMAEDISYATNDLNFYMFQPREIVNSEKNFFAMPGYTWDVYGTNTWVQTAHWNVAESNPKQMVTTIIQYVKNASKQQPYMPDPKGQSDSNRYMKSCLATHIYPSVFIGKVKDLDIQQKIRGQRRGWASWNKILQVKIENIPIIFENDGFVIAITSDKILGLKILNLIFGILVILGYQIYSIREFDLLEGTLNTKTMQIGSWRGPLNPVRYSLINYKMGRSPQDDLRDRILVQHLRNSIYVTRKIFQKPIAEDIRLLIESYTNFHETQYGQSLMLSWMLIERIYYRSWEKWLKTKSRNQDIKMPHLQFDKTLEFLKSVGNISKSDYDNLNKIRNLRNPFAHGKTRIDAESSKNCLDFAINLIKKQLLDTK